MKIFLLQKFASRAIALIITAGACANVSAVSVSIFNTGVSSATSKIAIGAFDPHWKIVAGPGITTPVSAVVVRDQSPLGSYYGTADAQWIWIDVNSGYNSNDGIAYTFQTTLDLTGYDSSTAKLTGFWGVDDVGSMTFNGEAPIGSGAFSITSDGFSRPHAFTISSGFVAGLNILNFSATNFYSWGAIDVTGLSATATPLTPITAVPEPSSSLFLLGGGCYVLFKVGQSGALRRRFFADSLKCETPLC